MWITQRCRGALLTFLWKHSVQANLSNQMDTKRTFVDPSNHVMIWIQFFLSLMINGDFLYQLCSTFFFFPQNLTRTGGSYLSHPSGPLSSKVERAAASPASSTQTWPASAGGGSRLQTVSPSPGRPWWRPASSVFPGSRGCFPSFSFSWVETVKNVAM